MQALLLIGLSCSKNLHQILIEMHLLAMHILELAHF